MSYPYAALSWLLSIFQPKPVTQEQSVPPRPQPRISEDRRRVEVTLTWPGQTRVIDPGINGRTERSVLSPSCGLIALIGQQPSGEKGRYNTWVTWHNTKTGQRIGCREGLAIQEVTNVEWIAVDELLLLIVAGRTGKVAEKTTPEIRVHAFRTDKPNLQADGHFENCSHVERMEVTDYPVQPLLRCTCLSPSSQQGYRVIRLMQLIGQ